MPRKYEPRVQLAEYTFDHWEPCMRESKYGKWVPLQAFEDTTRSLTAQNSRLKKRIQQLEAELKELKNA